MRKLLAILVILCSQSVVVGQQKLMLDVTAGKEIDLNSTYYPYTFSSLLKIGPFYLEGNYKYNNVMRTEHQLISEAQTYGGKLGLLRSSESGDGFNHFGFSLGFTSDDRIKRVGIDDATLYPYDLGGNRYEMDKFFIHSRTQHVSLGFKFIAYSNKKQKDLEEFADEFDLKFLKRKNIYSMLKFDMELLVASKIDYDTSIVYSPYGFFVPTDLYLNQNYKKQRIGFLMRFMYTPYMRIGFSAEMGMLPGIKFSTGTENDVNLTFKFGAHINFNYSTKN
jgi:predicted HAD superfamily phosphohydrolase YqeG